VTEGGGGYSGRETIRQAPMRNFHLTVGPNHVAEVRSIFVTHLRRWPFLVRDYSGYIWVDQPLISDGAGKFNIYVLYQPLTGGRYYHRRVLAIDETETAAVLKSNGTPVSRGSWTLSDFGKVTYGGGGTLTMSFMELVPVCFLTDQLTYKVMAVGSSGPIIGIQDVQLREILEPELIDLMFQASDSA
jgi:hypothetical protein